MNTPTEISQDKKLEIGTGTEIKPGEGVVFANLPQLIDAAKLMARSGICVPPHCRDQPGVCFAILMRTQNWKLKDPFFVAEHSYVVEQTKSVTIERQNQAGGTIREKALQSVETLAFDSSVFHAVILASGVLADRIEFIYHGEGDERVCTAHAQLKSGKWISHPTPPLRLCRPPVNEATGRARGSPLWQKNPDQQLAYFAVRDLARRYFPDVLGGIYDKDEFEETPIDMTPRGAQISDLRKRLPGRIAGDGFGPDNVANGLRGRQPGAVGEESLPPWRDGPSPPSEPPKAAKKPEQPTSITDYIPYAKAWIEAGTAGSDLLERWTAEQPMREALGMLSEDREELETLLKKRLQKL